MRKLLSFTRKEFYHILRDPLTLLIMFALPLMLMAILGYAVSTEIRNIPFVILDQSQSNDSRALVENLTGNAYFKLVKSVDTPQDVENAFKKGECSMAIIIPSNFGDEAIRMGVSDIQVMVDASDPNQAATMENYLQGEVMAFQQSKAKAMGQGAAINIDVKMLYNPQMLSTYSIVPGLSGIVLLLVCTFMTSISIVREKEFGTMENLLVSPIKPRVIIFAKTIPYLVVSIIDVILILLLSNLVMGVPINGSVSLLMFLSLVYIFTALALGMLISTITDTQQAAIITAGVGLMLPSLLLSGLIFPVESMPKILQWVSCLVPARWYIDALRDVMIKGLGFTAIWKQFAILLLMCVLLMVVCVKKFKNRL